MISIVLPYWRRASVLARCLYFYDKHYAGNLDFECIVVDDGSYDFDTKIFCEKYDWLCIVQLPKKDVPKNPCLPINVGVETSGGDVIVLSGPDILHEQPVLGPMLETLKEIGDNGYVLAACWFEQGAEWHCHSSLTKGGWHHGSGLKQPVGSGFHFCAMFNRSLWDKAGGFDPEYREGAYYDDPDWVNRAARAGAVFKIRDDLVVKHIRDGCYTDWPAGGAQRNRELYASKWAN